MSSRIRRENEEELDRILDNPNPSRDWDYERHDRNRVVDSWVLYDVIPAVRTIHKGRYLGPTDTEARVRTALAGARTALKELSDALHADRVRRTRQWKADHDDR